MANCAGTNPLLCNLRTAWTYCLQKIVATQCPEGTTGELAVSCEITLLTSDSSQLSSSLLDADVALWSSDYCPSAHISVTIKSSSSSVNSQIDCTTGVSQFLSLENMPMLSLGLTNITLATGGVSVIGLEGFSAAGVQMSGTAKMFLYGVAKVALTWSGFSDCSNHAIVYIIAGTDVLVQSCTFSRNYAGLFTMNNLYVLITSSTFVGNHYGVLTWSTDKFVYTRYSYFENNYVGASLYGDGRVHGSRFVLSKYLDLDLLGNNIFVSHCDFTITGLSVKIKNGAGISISYSNFVHQVGNANFKGGSLVIQGSDYYLANCHFSGIGRCVGSCNDFDNRLRYGALECSGCSILDSTFSNFAWQDYVGAVSLGNNTFLSGCTFENNFAYVWGGAIKIGKFVSGVTVMDTRFIGNSAMQVGAALHVESSDSVMILGGFFQGIRMDRL